MNRIFLVAIGVLLVALSAYSVTAQTTTKPTDAIATAQSALQTAQAGLVTPTIAATATTAATATRIPTNTPRPVPTATTRPTATSAATATATATGRSIRNSTATATAASRPTERPTLVPTSPPVTPSDTGVLQTYKVLVIIPSVYIVEGQTLRLPINEIQAAREAAESMPGWVRELSNGMGSVEVTVVVDAYPVSTFRQYCGGTVCGNWVGPTDIQRAISEQGGAARYDFVASFVPDRINGVEVMSCPCGGIAIARYMSVQMYGTRISQTTVIHELAHDVADFWLMRQGFDQLPTCDYDWTAVHCGYEYGGTNWGWFGGLLSGTLTVTNRPGITAEGWRYDTPVQAARNAGRTEAAEDFPWTGYEQPVAGHTDPEDPAMLTGIQPDGSFCHSGICS